MTSTSQIKEMKRYLFYEMSAEESDALEERYFEDAEYFYDLLELENDLIDSFAVGNLKGEDLKRFEKSLEKSPERREKIADARVLQTIIAEEKSKPAVVVTAVPSFWERIVSFFNFRNTGFQLAAGALAILLVCAAGFLLYRNWQSQNEFAEKENRREAERIEKENRLRQLEEEQKRIEEQRRQNEANNQQSENSNINVQQNNSNQQIEDKERNNEIEKLKKEVEDLEKRKNILPSNQKKVKPSNEVLAVSILSFRGDFSPTAKIDKINGEQQILLSVPVPLDKNYESIEVVSINGTDKKNIPEGAKFLVFYLPPNDTPIDIRATERNSSGGSKPIGRFRLEVKKTKK